MTRMSLLLMVLGAVGWPDASGAQAGAYRPPPVKTEAQARDFVKTFVERYGEASATNPAPVGSRADILEALRAHDLERYPAALDYLAQQKNAEGFALRSLVNLTWASGLDVASRLLVARRAALERVRDELAAKPKPSANERIRLDALAAEIADFRRMVEAVSRLRRPRLRAGLELAAQAVKVDPSEPLGRLASASAHRARQRWSAYEADDRWLREKQYEGPAVETLRAMIEWERFHRRRRAIVALEELTVSEPRFLRAQTQLVGLYEDIEDVHAELGQLRALRPDHWLVRWIWPSVHREWQTLRTTGAAGSSDPLH